MPLTAIRSVNSLGSDDVPNFTAPVNVDLLYSAGYYTPPALPFTYTPPATAANTPATYGPAWYTPLPSPVPQAATPRLPGAPQNIDVLYRQGYSPPALPVAQVGGAPQNADVLYRGGYNAPGQPIRTIAGAAPVPGAAVTPIGDQTSAGPVAVFGQSVGSLFSSPTGILILLGGGLLAFMALKKHR